MAMSVAIDKKNCQGHARCAKRSPDLYTLDADGYIAITGFSVPAGREADALAGARSCPERIISLLDEAGQKVQTLGAARQAV